MQTMAFPINWGTISLVLDQQAFEEGYIHGRQYYFDDAWEEQKREGSNETLTASHLLGLIAVRDGHGCYQLDDGQDKSVFRNGVEELLGVLVGYLSGPLHPETPEERARRQSECIVIEE
ncbi:MAG TPA: hypothetical protein VKY19_28930 [Ktedonosporobacter sp.]|jgi:hypothetical protein|nr:hypothetical protein [Ktedonosporobacter sp.]